MPFATPERTSQHSSSRRDRPSPEADAQRRGLSTGRGWGPRRPAWALTAALLALVALAAACGGGDDDTDEATTAPTADGASPTAVPQGAACDFPVVEEEIDSQLLPLVISSDLAIGENRFQVGLIDQATSQVVPDADLHFKFICFDSEEGSVAFEQDATAVTLTKTYTHTHEDGTVETHEAGETGAYTAYVDFDRAGVWGVEVTGTTADGTELEPATPKFSVNLTSFGLSVGDPAPQSVQTLASDVDDIKDIDTSVEPIEAQHTMTIADAVTSGKPTVIAFATPAFCQTQICGPVKEIFDDLYTDYGDRANFVHIEPYDVPRMRSGDCEDLASCLSPVLDEWKLQYEPWVFIVDAEGNIAQKFDGVISKEEVEAALQATLSPGEGA
jgi:hypothetical protein